MSSKTARKQRAAARAPEASVRRPAVEGRLARLPRRWLYGGLAALAVVIAAALVLASQLGGDSAEPPAAPAGASAGAISGAETAALLEGIRQEGTSLGSAEAPVVLYEFADLQCPFCQQWDAEVLPALIEEYVRPGDLRIVFQGLAFLGPDSGKALRVALAAADQDRLWHVVDLLYRHQGGENDGWVTDGLVDGIVEAVPGLDAERVLDARESEAVAAEIAAAAEQADSAGISRTPSFLIGNAAGELERLEFDTYAPGPFRETIDRLLGR